MDYNIIIIGIIVIIIFWVFLYSCSSGSLSGSLSGSFSDSSSEIQENFNIIDMVQSKAMVNKLTNRWINNVVNKGGYLEDNPLDVYNMFCKNGILVGTVSEKNRRGAMIKNYFDYFARLPNINAYDIIHDIDHISSNVWVDNARITWTWDGLNDSVECGEGDGANGCDIVARMTFIWLLNDNSIGGSSGCLFELHSSGNPGPNEGLLNTENRSVEVPKIDSDIILPDTGIIPNLKPARPNSIFS